MLLACGFGTTSTPQTLEQFEADALRLGFDAVLEKRYVPGAVVETHVHAFAAKAVVEQARKGGG